MIPRSVSHLLWFAACAAFLLIGCRSESDETAAPAGDEAAAPGGEVTAPVTGAAKVNLNTASEEEFLALPNVGERMAHEFEEYRPYVSIQQFRREIGKYVDESQVAAYEEYVFVPVSPNESDEPTLMQLPGVDAGSAAELAAGRPYASPEAFLDKLGEYVSASQVAAARAYLTSR